MLIQIYRNLTVSSQAIHDLNERVLTYMLGNHQPSTWTAVAIQAHRIQLADIRNECLNIACNFLEMTNQQKTPAGIMPFTCY